MQTRDKVIGTRFHPDELEMVRQLANSRGLTVSEQMREAVMMHVLRLGRSIVPPAGKRFPTLESGLESEP